VSAVPLAIDALVGAFKRELGRVQVIDGPPTQDVPGDVVAVGLAPQEPADVETTETRAGLAAVHEQFVVLCVARSWSGNEPVKPQRDRSYALVASVRKALKADPTLGGVVQRAVFAGATYTPWRTDRGAIVVDVPFRVAVDVLS
jgi:hypothetical protein